MIKKGYASEKLVISWLKEYCVSTRRFDESGICTNLQCKESMSENHSSSWWLTNKASHQSLHTFTVTVCFDSIDTGMLALASLEILCWTIRPASDNTTCNKAICGHSL